MRLTRWLLILVPLVGLAAAGWWLLSSVHASMGYAVEAQFGALPADDARLEQWLRAQRGVVPHTVSVRRAGPEGTVVKVFFIQSRNLLGRPAIPPLDQACRDLGYGAPAHGFRDSKER